MRPASVPRLGLNRDAGAPRRVLTRLCHRYPSQGEEGVKGTLPHLPVPLAIVSDSTSTYLSRFFPLMGCQPAIQETQITNTAFI